MLSVILHQIYPFSQYVAYVRVHYDARTEYYFKLLCCLVISLSSRYSIYVIITHLGLLGTESPQQISWILRPYL